MPCLHSVHRALNKNCLISGLDHYFGHAQVIRSVRNIASNVIYLSPTGGLGSGAGRGGGGGGSVRESGGGLGELGAAREEQFFFNKQREQLEKIKKRLKDAKSGELTQKEEK